MRKPTWNDMLNNRSCNRVAQDDEISLDYLNLKPIEHSILTAARFYFSSFARPEESAWMNVVMFSERFFPGENSSKIAQALLIVVHEIRISRRSTLRFQDPICINCKNRATTEERHFVLMIKEVWLKHSATALTHAMLLCEGNKTSDLMRAINKLVSLTQLDGSWETQNK